MTALQEFRKKKDFLICVDSDGCAMDTMDVKHIKCFGPCMVDEWNLHHWKEHVLKRWNEINLYTMTRGINRFKGLAIALMEFDRELAPVTGLTEFVQWTERTSELSNEALEQEIQHSGSICCQKALAWSQNVNRKISALAADDKKPFTGVEQGLAAASAFADVAIVSSANPDAVREEWERCGLVQYVDLMLAQDTGSKARCIHELRGKGYPADHVLMVGDAPGDQAAAQENGVYYYPILVRREAQSWKELRETGLTRLKEGNYAEYGMEKLREFLKNLGA